MAGIAGQGKTRQRKKSKQNITKTPVKRKTPTPPKRKIKK